MSLFITILNKKFEFQFHPIHSMNLSELKKGEKAIILSIDESPIRIKLFEMGCIPGEHITLENIAPFGDPIAISVSDYKLSLRLNEAFYIQIQKVSTEQEPQAA